MRHLLLIPAFVIVACGSGPTAPTPPPVPSFQGQWTGDYTVTSCSGTQSFATGFCDAVGGSTIRPIVLTLNQADRQVTGTMTLGGANVPVTGTVSAAGRLLLTGTGQLLLSTAAVQMTIVGWDSALVGATMTGGWGTSWTSTATAGTGNTTQAIRVMTKTD